MNKQIFEQCVCYAAKERKTNSKIKNCLLRFGLWIRHYCLHKTALPYLELFITTNCNLKCKGCSNLIPTLKKTQNIPASEIKSIIYKLLKNSDVLYRLKIHGGEVFLHPDLPDILEYVKKNKRIKSIRVTTNGTIMPTKQTLDCLKDSRIVVQISDYNFANSTRTRLMETFRLNNIKFVFLEGQEWKDMGDFIQRSSNRFNDCTIKRCTSSINGKIYICSRAAIMAMIGVIPDDGISILSDPKHFRSQINKLYSTQANACSYCDGDTVMAKTITAGLQE